MLNICTVYYGIALQDTNFGPGKMPSGTSPPPEKFNKKEKRHPSLYSVGERE
jgi:hypothetical protein